MKKGISLMVVVIAVTVMLILISTASVIGSSSINTANYDEFNSKVDRVWNLVNEYYVKNGVLPVTSEVISKESLGSDFVKVVTENGDLNENLIVVDMSKLKITGIDLGYGNILDQNVFLVAQNTQNVYYMRGYNYRGKIYYSVK